ncbi:MAM and LDL-receptor class A domain-containing protein 1-like [Anneissia japonica]|uniref:MAM and LDL-receptor class A domain-containing protein 1-like n=1 Tax=Anneissia japonica TaxID=1529436 RepID=UPI001425B4E0|nr:MAM and LDL-receptor class A domain-containing protein 1-like [Anneissia japonica]
MDGEYDGALTIYQQMTYNDYTDLVQVSELVERSYSYWKLLRVPLRSLPEDFQVVIEDVRGARGNIAIDDVSLSANCIAVGDIPGFDQTRNYKFCDDGRRLRCGMTNQCFETTQRCDFILDCDDGSDENECGTTCGFENDWCGWKINRRGGINWIRSNGRSAHSRDTRPRIDHTKQNPKGFYIYLETSERNDSLSALYHENIHLYSPVLQHSSAVCKFSMWYNMRGYGIGTISVYIRTYTPKQTTLLRSIKQSDDSNWVSTGDILIGHREQFTVLIEYTLHAAIRGHVALDDILFKDCGKNTHQRRCSAGSIACNDSSCVAGSHVCDLKNDCPCKTDEKNCQTNGGCTFNNVPFEDHCGWQQMNGDDFDWTQSQVALRGGPTGDHTGGSNGFFLLLTQPHGSNKGGKSQVTTAEFETSENVCFLRFWYHICGVESSLRVFTRSSNSDGAMLLMWQHSQSSNDWDYVNIPVANVHTYSVVFEGIIGANERQCVALDDVTFSAECPYTGRDTLTTPRDTVLPPLEQEGDSIVLLVILATCVVIVVLTTIYFVIKKVSTW